MLYLLVYTCNLNAGNTKRLKQTERNPRLVCKQAAALHGLIAIWSIGEREFPAGRCSLGETMEAGQKEGEEFEWRESKQW